MKIKAQKVPLTGDPGTVTGDVAGHFVPFTKSWLSACRLWFFYAKMEVQFPGNLDLLIYPYFNDYYYFRLTVLPGVTSAQY